MTRRVVVIGAGSAGAVIAARLSEDPDVQVTLLEAGPDHRSAETPPEIAGPSWVAAKDLPGRFWPNLMATRAAGQVARPYVRGLGVGGSSAINAMIALPGEPDDYDEWAAQYGCDGWAWSDVAPWFARTELVLERARLDEWGPINRLTAAVFDSAAGGMLLTRSATGRRVSVNDAYLEPARSRPNLRIVGSTLVDRVLFDGRRATGLLTADGEEIDADLVVVSAGAIHSPAVLLRSGVDTPGVGENLHDHPSFPVAVELVEPVSVGSLPIATLAQLSSGAAVHDLQVLPIEYVDTALPGLGMVMAAVMRVWSRGRVTVASTDPLADPVVEFAMLSDERDVVALSAAIDAAERLLDHPRFVDVGSVIPFDRSEAGMRAAIGDYVHAAGSCAMGVVVDARCRLHGYEGVVVCDASVIPNLPRANTHLPTVMIAERIAATLAGDSER